MKRDIFGTAPDGSDVQRVVISGGGLTLSVLSWGCVFQDLRLAGHDAPLVLGYTGFSDYLEHSPYFGATAGRYANRIRDGRFDIDGMPHQVDTNFLGKHMLHGGVRGVGKRNWRFSEVSGNEAVLELLDRDGEMGFPGNCTLRACFTLSGDGVVDILYEARTDAATLVNLAHHSYFNLDGGADILDHQIRIDAQAYLPVDEELIPTGERRPVAGTDFDFRQFRPVRRAVDGAQAIYDHNFCLADTRRKLTSVAQVVSPRSGVKMEVATTEPGIQFYAGHKLATRPAGLAGSPYGAFAGLCLEPQIWPDSPHHPTFPQAVLRPGEQYRQETRLRFTRA